MTICLDLRKKGQCRHKARYHVFCCLWLEWGQIQHRLCMWMPNGGAVMAAKVCLDHCMLFAPVHTPSTPFVLPSSRFLPQWIVVGIMYPVGWIWVDVWMRGGPSLWLEIFMQTNFHWQWKKTGWTLCSKRPVCHVIRLVLLPSAQGTITSSRAVPVIS